MATVGQPGVLRRITVHYANSPTRSTGEADLDDLDDDLLQFVLADILPDISCVPSPSDSDDDHDHHDHGDEEADRQDDNDDDPDNMTYEQRQALVESVGTEDRGLSDELISYLQPWKYKAPGFFSRKTTHEESALSVNMKYLDRASMWPRS
ncbi:hypothetical protein BAE44_0006270 [Dichanthelium oligosanthes]|uniref:Uncharacterized protein n=1 Tax=Dichanthelium oligosanthes TaxID=888268 RepID=A0A1E5W5X8_9POAL|nr:hypothetical protein BAE44_0006270 [Dichanthelium oligosanthes]